MKFLKNSFGFSLVEVMIGLGLMATTAYMFALQSKLQTQSESKFRTQQSLNDLEIEISRNFADKAVCEHALEAAFIDETFNEQSILGNEDHKKLYKKGFNNAFPELGSVNKLFQEGRIRVGDIVYELSNIENVENKPLEKTAELALKVTFERCSQGGVIGRDADANSGSSLCQGVSSITKTFGREVSFNIDEQNKITSIRCMGVGASGGGENTGGDTGGGAGGDDGGGGGSTGGSTGGGWGSNPTLACKNEAKILLKNEIAGPTSCGWTLTLTPRKTEYLTPVTNQVFTKPNMNLYVSNSMHFTIQGAGGGGGQGRGGGFNVGAGGSAGMALMGKINDSFLENNDIIYITTGAGGQGTYVNNWNSQPPTDGGNSSIRVENPITNPPTVIATYEALGGFAGKNDHTFNMCYGCNNSSYAGHGENSQFARGGRGGIRECNGSCGTSAVAGTKGSGGGGGYHNSGHGAAGGNGFVWIEWLEYTAVDQDGNSINVFEE